MNPFQNKFGGDELSYDKKSYYYKVINGGLGIGILNCVPQYLNWAFNETLFSGWMVFLFQVIVIVALLYTFGKQAAAIMDKGDGYSFGKAFGFAMMTSLCAGFVAAFFAWLLMSVIDPTMSSKLINATYEQAELMNLDEAATEMAVKTTTFFTSFGGMVMSNILSMVISGGLLGLITSALVKRNPTI